MKNVEEKIGNQNVNSKGHCMTVIEYNSYSDIKIVFDDGTIIKTSYSNFKKGNVRNPNARVFCGIGFLGVGNYDCGSNRREVNTWSKMLERCYKANGENTNNHVYKDCEVCEEWHNFQNFAQWYENNVWGDFKDLEVDKDILFKNNKIYSPKTCVLVPHSLNNLFTKSNRIRGDYPIGVHRQKRGGYVAQCNFGDKKKRYLGYFKTPDEAFTSYKIAKENYIKEVADEYKSKYKDFPEKLYRALYCYSVDKND